MNEGTLSTQKQQQQAHQRKKVTALIEKGSYRRALELMGGRSHPGHPTAGMEREYITAIDKMIAAGEESFSRGEYAAAGQSFKCTLDYYPADPTLRKMAQSEPNQIKARLEECSNHLMEQGLQEYRRGNLENAIKKWKGLIAFNGGHKEARKAIETATIQLRALQGMEKRGR